MIVSTDAIVLNSRKYSETSKIVSLFTKDFGRLSVIARGARQKKSKFGSALEPMSKSYVTIYKKPQKDLHTISDAEIVNGYKNIKESYEHLASGFMVLEAVNQSVHENEINLKLFNLLSDTFEVMDLNTDNPYSVFIAFALKLAVILGFEIMNNNEQTFDSQDFLINGKIYFSLEDGSPITNKANSNNNLFVFNNESFNLLQKFTQTSLEESHNIEITNQLKQILNNFFSVYFSFHLEKRFALRSFNLIKSM